MWEQREQCVGPELYDKSVPLQHKVSSVAANKAGGKSWSLPAQRSGTDVEGSQYRQDDQ